MNHSLLKLYIITLWLHSLASVATADESTRYWAYPDGVLTSVDTSKAKLTGDRSRVKEEAKAEENAEKSVQTLASELHGLVKQCLIGERAAHPPTAALNDAPRYLLSFLFRISEKGAAVDLEKNLSQAARKLPCLSQSQQILTNFKFTPPPRDLGLNARIDIRGIILADDDAKGRGFKFYERQMIWDKTLKDHREWFQCQQHGECAARLSGCDPKAVNRKYVEAYDAAHALRELPACSRMRHRNFNAECVKGRCVVK